MDAVPERDRERIFEERKELINKAAGAFEIHSFMTSIWDETLYQVWSAITHSLILDMENIKMGLDELSTMVQSDELVLFEKSTFLEIAHVAGKDYNDPSRFEKISNIIKQFKLGLFGTNREFESLTVKNSKFRSYLINFTKASYLLVVVSNSDVEEVILKMNIDSLKPCYDDMVVASIS